MACLEAFGLCLRVCYILEAWCAVKAVFFQGGSVVSTRVLSG